MKNPFKKVKPVEEEVVEQEAPATVDEATLDEKDESLVDKYIEENAQVGEFDDKFVSLVNINKVYDNKFHAVFDFNLDIKKREFVVFVGPSGCGKSTTLRMIAGLEDISSGDLYINGERANELLAKDRDIAMVFQNYALYPNMTVYNNMAFALKVRHIKKDEIRERVNEAARILEIEDQLKKKPKELSGGQRQRVALGRAIVRNARIFLMDEPLSNLDAKLRVQMRSEIINLHRKLNATTIYVTHDQTEAMTMADRIVVMKLGVVQQIGTPREIYRHPANLFVASFIGSPAMNLIKAKYSKGVIIFQNGDEFKLSKEQVIAHDTFYRQCYANETRGEQEYYEQLDRELADFNKKHHKQKYIDEFNEKYNSLKEGKKTYIDKLDEIIHGADHDVTFGIRPESIVECEKKDPDAMEIEVKLSELLGDQYYIHFDFGGKNVLSKVLTEKTITTGEKLFLKIQREKVHLFDADTEVTII